jgi:tetratricopeptide (TPR) repeat protein
MNKKALAISIIAVILSFVGGFILANSLNRKDLDALRTENAQLKNKQSQSVDVTLEEEIQNKIAEADRNPSNFEFQRNLARGIYGYSRIRQDAKFLPEAARLLKRASELNPQDYDTIVALGNVYLYLGKINKDNAAIEQSREYFRKALAVNKTDADVQNDLGLTYFYAEPPQAEKAIAEYQKALQMNPKHETSLENLIRANLSLDKIKEAEDYLNKLKQFNPKNESLRDLEAQIAQSGNKQ